MTGKKTGAWLLVLSLLVAVVLPANQVQAIEYQPIVPVLTIYQTVNVFEGKAGDTIKVSLPVKVTSFVVREPIITLEWEADQKPLELVSDFTFTREDVSASTTVKDLALSKVTYINFSVKISESARKGDYELGKMHFFTTDSMNNYCDLELNQPRPVIIRVTQEKALPEFRILDQSLPETIKPEDDFQVELTFGNESTLPAENVTIKVTGAEESGLIPKNFYNTVEAGTVAAGGRVKASFSYSATKVMTSGVKTLTAVVSFELADKTTYTREHPFYLEAVDKEETSAPTESVVQLIQTDHPKEISAEETFKVHLEYQNVGTEKVTNVQVKLRGYSDAGFVPNFILDTVALNDLEPEEKNSADFSLTAAKDIASGIKSLTAVVSYQLENGTACSWEQSIYLEAVSKEETKPDPAKPMVHLIQADYPREILAEQTFQLRLKYQNEGEEKVTNVLVQLSGYSEAGFIPNFIYDTVSLKDLKPGRSDTLSFSLTAAKSLSPGPKGLSVKVSYKLTDGQTLEDTVSLYIEGLVEKQEVVPVTNSKPKLLVQDYNLGVEKLMAGSEFVFQFTVLNTHSTARADNIKVTVSSADNTFSIVEGSSSFLIPSIVAGESTSCEIPLRVKGDAATDGYDLSVTFDYEYAAKDENGNDISKSDTMEEKLKIPVYSNDRPMVSNINVGYWDLPKVNELTTMSFEFYNMGKSPLYNVIATVEGDFDSAGSMVMIGNVEPGSGKSWELDVTPMMEGYSSGVLHITYEDSNGNISEFEESFGSDVQSTSIDDWTGNGDMVGDDMWNVDGSGIVETKKPILPIWAYTAILAVLFLVSMSVTRTVLIKRYKKKELKKLEDELD